MGTNDAEVQDAIDFAAREMKQVEAEEREEAAHKLDSASTEDE